MKTETFHQKKNHPEIVKFLNSLGKSFKKLELQTATRKHMSVLKKRMQLKRKVAQIAELTDIDTYDFERLCNELIKTKKISVSAFLDPQEFDQLG